MKSEQGKAIEEYNKAIEILKTERSKLYEMKKRDKGLDIDKMYEVKLAELKIIELKELALKEHRGGITAVENQWKDLRLR